MATISLSEPPALSGAKYADYRDWLHTEFFRHVCCYCCLDSSDGTEIEHVIPQSYAPSLIHDPLNLLLVCPKCNNLKRDYHPSHSMRQKFKFDTTGYHAIDPRSDDYSTLFSLDASSGCISGKNDRAKWNILLFDYHLRENLSEKRRIYLELARCLDAFLHTTGSPPVFSHPWARVTCDTLAQYGYLFLITFEIEMSPALRELLLARRIEILSARRGSQA